MQLGNSWYAPSIEQCFQNISVYFTDWLDVTFEELACWYIFVPVKFLYPIMIKLQWGTVNCYTIYPIII